MKSEPSHRASSSTGRPKATSRAASHQLSWLLAFVLAILFSAATAIGSWLLFTPQFVASAIFRIAEQEPKLIFATDENSRPFDFEVYKRTQAELVRSRFVLESALRAPDIVRLPAVREQGDAVARAERHISIDFPGEGELMRISFRNNNPETAAAVANAVSKAYMREVVDVERRHRMDRLMKLEKLFNDSEEQMRAKQADLKRIVDSLGLGNGNGLSARQQITLQQFAAQQNAHTNLRNELMRTRLTLTVLEKETAFDMDPQDADKDRIRDLKRQVAVLTAEEQQMKEEVEKLAKVAESIGSSNFDVEMMRSDLQQMATLNAALGKEIESMRVELRSPSRVSELQPADVPLERDMSAWIETTTILTIFAFVLPFVAVSLWNTRGQVPAGDAPVATAGDIARREIIEAIERLGDLEAKGILSHDEFASKKAELLARI
jgi:capsular polysaccharide biosynthesis protein